MRSVGDCSISLKFRTYFDHMTLNASRTFKVNGSKRINIKKRYNSSPDKLSKFRLGEKYLRGECNTLHGVQGY